MTFCFLIHVGSENQLTSQSFVLEFYRSEVLKESVRGHRILGIIGAILLCPCLYHGNFISVLPTLIIFWWYCPLRIILPIDPGDSFLFWLFGSKCRRTLLFFDPPIGVTNQHSHKHHIQCLRLSTSNFHFQLWKVYLV